MKAQPITDAVTVARTYEFQGIGFLYVDIDPSDPYGSFVALPAALTYDGRMFGKSCFDSDRNVAIFRSDVKVARKVA